MPTRHPQTVRWGDLGPYVTKVLGSWVADGYLLEDAAVVVLFEEPISIRVLPHHQVVEAAMEFPGAPLEKNMEALRAHQRINASTPAMMTMLVFADDHSMTIASTPWSQVRAELERIN